jgi:hypothetical protein
MENVIGNFDLLELQAVCRLLGLGGTARQHND